MPSGLGNHPSKAPVTLVAISCGGSPGNCWPDVQTPLATSRIAALNLTIGTFTPPFGLNIFVFQAMFKTPSAILYAGLVPFIILAVVALMLVTYIPVLSLILLPYVL